MSKFLCTLTIFAAICGSIITAFVIQMPKTLWWSPSYSLPAEQVPLFFWALMNILVPAAFSVAGIGVIVWMWKLASALCDWLRSRRKS